MKIKAVLPCTVSGVVVLIAMLMITHNRHNDWIKHPRGECNLKAQEQLEFWNQTHSCRCA